MKNKELTAIKAQGNNMMLVTGYWQNTDTFKMIPITEDCPYSEVIYDPNTTLLVVISKIAKTNFQMIPRLDDNGNQVRASKKKDNGNPFKEQRTTIDVFTEYYIVEKEEQETFVDLYAKEFFAPRSIQLKYIRKPASIDKRNGIGCELPEHTHHEIVEMAVKSILEGFESPRYQTQSSEVLESE